MNTPRRICPTCNLPAFSGCAFANCKREFASVSRLETDSPAQQQEDRDRRDEHRAEERDYFGDHQS